jgi:hypothetical protein
VRCDSDGRGDGGTSLEEVEAWRINRGRIGGAERQRGQIGRGWRGRSRRRGRTGIRGRGIEGEGETEGIFGQERRSKIFFAVDQTIPYSSERHFVYTLPILRISSDQENELKAGLTVLKHPIREWQDYTRILITV